MFYIFEHLVPLPRVPGKVLIHPLHVDPVGGTQSILGQLADFLQCQLYRNINSLTVLGTNFDDF